MGLESFDDALVQELQLGSEICCEELQLTVGEPLSLDLMTLEIVNQKNNFVVVVFLKFRIPLL